MISTFINLQSLEFFAGYSVHRESWIGLGGLSLASNLRRFKVTYNLVQNLSLHYILDMLSDIPNLEDVVVRTCDETHITCEDGELELSDRKKLDSVRRLQLHCPSGDLLTPVLQRFSLITDLDVNMTGNYSNTFARNPFLCVANGLEKFSLGNFLDWPEHFIFDVLKMTMPKLREFVLLGMLGAPENWMMALGDAKIPRLKTLVFKPMDWEAMVQGIPIAQLDRLALSGAFPDLNRVVITVESSRHDSTEAQILEEYLRGLKSSREKFKMKGIVVEFALEDGELPAHAL